MESVFSEQGRDIAILIVISTVLAKRFGIHIFFATLIVGFVLYQFFSIETAPGYGVSRVLREVS